MCNGDDEIEFSTRFPREKGLVLNDIGIVEDCCV